MDHTDQPAQARPNSLLPARGTKERAYLYTVLRSRLEALKFVPEYRASWERLEAEVGRNAVLAALAKLREDLEAPDASKNDLVLALANLAPSSRVGRLGPVDPLDPDDPVDLEDLIEQLDGCPSIDPLWMLTHFGIGHAARLGPDRPGWTSVSLDLLQSKSVLRAGLDILVRARRAEAGVETTKRVLRERVWDDDLGPRTAFQLLRAVETEPETSQRAHARTLLGADHAPEYLDKTASDLLTVARAAVSEERSHHLAEVRAKSGFVTSIFSPSEEGNERLSAFYRSLLEFGDLMALHTGWDPRQEPFLRQLEEKNG